MWTYVEVNEQHLVTVDPSSGSSTFLHVMIFKSSSLLLTVLECSFFSMLKGLKLRRLVQCLGTDVMNELLQFS